MKLHYILTFSLFFAAILNPCRAERVRVSAPEMEIVLDAAAGENLRIMYFGPKLSDTDFENISYSGIKQYDAYPAYGRGSRYAPAFEPAFAVTHADGNMTLDLAVLGTQVQTEPSGANGTVGCSSYQGQSQG